MRRAKAGKSKERPADNPVKIIIQGNMKEDSKKDKGKDRAAKR